MSRISKRGRSYCLNRPNERFEERHPLRFAHGALVIVELVKPIEPERANRLVRAAARALAEVDFETPEARMMRLKQRVAIRNPYEVDFLWEKLLEHGADLDVELLKGSLERLKASEQWKANVLTNIARSLIARSSGSSENERKNQRAEQAEHEIRGDPLAG